jgi:hypothetical protein
MIEPFLGHSELSLVVQLSGRVTGDLRVDGIDDLKAALDTDPKLAGGAEILELLERRYDELNARGSAARKS